MSNFIDDIKITVDDKKRIMLDIWYTIINLDIVPSLQEIITLQKDSTKKLSEEELLAIYNLSVEIKKLIKASGKNQRLFEYLEIDNNSINSERLYDFTSFIATDIMEVRKKAPNVKWYLQVNKILDRMEGKNPHKDALEEQPKRGKIIKLSEYNNNDNKPDYLIE